MSQANDLKFGNINEKDVLPRINRFFKDTAVAFEEMYSTQDYHSHQNIYELKSRRIKHDTYKTAIIGVNKAILKPADKGKTLYFLFLYTDGLYYIQYYSIITLSKHSLFINKYKSFNFLG